MNRNKFIRKWLGNKNYPYTDENRGLMLDDLDLLIEQALHEHIVSNSEADSDCDYDMNVKPPFKTKRYKMKIISEVAIRSCDSCKNNGNKGICIDCDDDWCNYEQTDC